MKLTILLVAIVLAGCGGNPVKTSFPDVPEKIMVEPKPLQKISASSSSISVNDSSASQFKLSEISAVITANYGICNEYREQIFSLKSWILDQKAANP